ncbi:MAG: hydrolase [Eubacteriales bacterium]|nr:hydrolase [Eubacteriales bacterium]
MELKESTNPTMNSIGGGKAEDGSCEKAESRTTNACDAGFTREDALALLKKYNQDAFHLQHAYTVEAVMKWYAAELGAGNEDFWGLCGLLHDIDFENWPEEHCKKAPELLAEIGASDALVHAVVSHGYGICSDVEPTAQMEKVLFASDELTGLIGAAALMRPSRSCTDMELKSLKKKFKDKRFAAGCDREIIAKGAEALGWELDELLDKTLKAMAATEADIQKEMGK